MTNSINYANDLFVRAARGEKTERTPVWLMRQAGRTDPEYLKLKEESALPLHELFRHAELAARISLLPKRIGVDAIIFFQDILTQLSPMGAHFVFAPGPVLEEPLRTESQIKAYHTFDVAEELSFVPETFRIIRETINDELPVLGFAGAPLTLAAFLIEGKSFASDAAHFIGFMREQPKALHRLLDLMAEITIDYMKLQAEAGAAAVQLFESCAHLLSQEQYEQFALPYQQKIFNALEGIVPTIIFAREWDDLGTLAGADSDIISLPANISIRQAREQLGQDQVLQGNLDNQFLVDASLDEITKAAQECVAQGEHRGHIFNLSHGLLRQTPFENVKHVVNVVRNC